MTDRRPHEAHLDDDFLFEVVHGLRSEAEALAAVEHARSCADCDRRLRALAGDRERLRTRAPVVAATEPATARRPSVAGKWRRPGPLVPILAAAAVLAIVVSAVVLRAPAPRPISTLPGLPASLDVVRLRAVGEDDDLPRLERALEAYARRDWTRAAALLETPFASARLEPLRRLYRASALLERGHDAEAQDLLAPIARLALPEPYATWRDWARLSASEDPADAARADSLARRLAPGAR